MSDEVPGAPPSGKPRRLARRGDPPKRKPKPCPHRDDFICSVCEENVKLRAENAALRAKLKELTK